MTDFQEALDRMRSGAYSIYNLNNLDEWLCKNTLINDKPFNFKDREFQIDILRDPKRESIVVKPAQVGLSELSYRWAVASCCIMPNFTVIYTFPTAGDAVKNNQTRINPMIEGSPEVKRLVNPDLNNSEVKQFGRNSFLFFKGTMAETAALSTPADAVINDEWDKSDMDVGTTYVSRLQDKPTKIRKIFSTPTLAGYGVDKEARTANRLRHFVECNKCNHHFLPDYFSDVKIPGYSGPLEEITKELLPKIRWQEALLLCPKCGRDPEMHHTRMHWVNENNELDYVANAWFVTPFSAHKRITVPYLIESSTKYKRYSEFKNQGLGLTAEEKNESITLDDIEKAQAQVLSVSSDLHQMGVDYGLTCNITVGRETNDGELMVVHRERVPYYRVEERIAELRITYNITTNVHDSQPYTDIVNRICGNNPHAWGAVFVNSKSPVPFSPREQEEDKEEGKMGFRIVNVNRNVALDDLLSLIKSGKLVVSASEENTIFQKQMLSLKRQQKFTTQGELQYVWVKTGDEEDHYHFSLLYLYIAIRMRHTAGTAGIASTGISPLIVVKQPGLRKRVTNGSIW